MDIDFGQVKEELYSAVSQGDITGVKFMLSRFSYSCKELNLAFSDAVVTGHIPIVDLLLTYGANIHYNNELAFKDALNGNDYPMINYLLSKGSNPISIREYPTCYPHQSYNYVADLVGNQEVDYEVKENTKKRSRGSDHNQHKRKAF